MLAGEGDFVKVHRREKHSMPVDPNNKHWVNDKSKFGYKMLLKMGWSEGKGLGSQEQGMTENITQIKTVERVGINTTLNISFLFVIRFGCYCRYIFKLA
jgi:hypothetical protein